MANLTMVTDEITSSLTDAQTLVAKERLQLARDLEQQAKDVWWELCGVLYEIHEGALYQAEGYESWSDFVDEQLNIGQTSARNAVNTVKWLNGFDDNFKQWVYLQGSTKASLMAGRFTPEDAPVWRNRLEGLTCRQMEAILRGKDPGLLEAPIQVQGTTTVMGADYGADGYDSGMPPPVSSDSADGDDDDADPVAPVLPPDADQAEVVHFSLFPEQRRNLSQALEHAKGIAQTDKSGHALDLICTAYLAGEGGHTSVHEYLSSVSKALGLRIVAFRRDLSIAYGEETLGLVVDLDS